MIKDKGQRIKFKVYFTASSFDSLRHYSLLDYSLFNRITKNSPPHRTGGTECRGGLD